MHAMDVFYCKRCATLRGGVPGQRVSFHEERAGSWRSNAGSRSNGTKNVKVLQDVLF